MSWEHSLSDVTRREWDSTNVHSRTPNRATLAATATKLAWINNIDGKLLRKIRKIIPPYQIDSFDFVEYVCELDQKTLRILKEMDGVEVFLRLYCFWKYSSDKLPYPSSQLTLGSPYESQLPAKSKLKMKKTKCAYTGNEAGDDGDGAAAGGEGTPRYNSAFDKWVSCFQEECETQLYLLNLDGFVDPPERTMPGYMEALAQNWNQLPSDTPRWLKAWKWAKTVPVPRIRCTLAKCD